MLCNPACYVTTQPSPRYCVGLLRSEYEHIVYDAIAQYKAMLAAAAADAANRIFQYHSAGADSADKFPAGIEQLAASRDRPGLEKGCPGENSASPGRAPRSDAGRPAVRYLYPTLCRLYGLRELDNGPIVSERESYRRDDSC